MRAPARALVLALVLATGSGAAHAQVSPGPLAAAHASLDGPTECFRCHAKTGGKAGMDARCLDCHTEVAQMRTQRRGYHARVTSSACASCHPDHGGRAFALVAWENGSPERFDHARAGFALIGKHATLACKDCHRPELQKSAVVPLLRVKDRSRSWLGLEQACASCHDDPHKGSLGNACASCHAQTKWNPAPGFDHAKTGYALSGAHAKLACITCHATPAVNAGTDAKGAPRALWKPVPHADCASCHRDPHAGRFTGACARCHTTAGWKRMDTRGFDHDQTRYPLRGAHVAVTCDDCHAASHGGRRPPHDRCMACHREAHEATAAAELKGADCAVCHAVQGWTPSTWPRAKHQATAYPLEGAHRDAECRGCHTRAAAGSAEAAALGSSRVRLHPGHERCVPCHRDSHGGRFSRGGARARAAECLACHTFDTFRPSRFDARAHADSPFALEGAHRAVPCQRCHEELAAPAAASSLRGAAGRELAFTRERRACADCHADPHGGQLKDKGGACDRCHGIEAFVPAARFDHDRDAVFPLQGAHARTPCAACHRATTAGRDGERVVRYRPTPTKCESCHTSGAGGARRERLLFPTHAWG